MKKRSKLNALLLKYEMELTRLDWELVFATWPCRRLKQRIADHKQFVKDIKESLKDASL